jgi:hypothetical protein
MFCFLRMLSIGEPPSIPLGYEYDEKATKILEEEVAYVSIKRSRIDLPVFCLSTNYQLGARVTLPPLAEVWLPCWSRHVGISSLKYTSRRKFSRAPRIYTIAAEDFHHASHRTFSSQLPSIRGDRVRIQLQVLVVFPMFCCKGKGDCFSRKGFGWASEEWPITRRSKGRMAAPWNDKSTSKLTQPTREREPYFHASFREISRRVTARRQ